MLETSFPQNQNGSQSINKEKIAIIGSGLVGSLMALLFAKKGLDVEVYERRPDLRKKAYDGGRSINLALSNRGLRALKMIGLEKEAAELCIPMYGREVHPMEGESYYMQYGKDGEAINSISRGGLNYLLLKKADEFDNIHFHFSHRCEDANLDKGKVTFLNTENQELTEKKFKAIFGTDGAFSAIRSAIQKSDGQDFNYEQFYIEHSYKELTIPAGPLDSNGNGTWQLNKDALHIWPRKSFMMIALPNLDGSFTCTLFLAKKGEISFEHLHSDSQINDFFETYFKNAKALMPSLVEDFLENPVSNLVTIRCSPWNVSGKALILGDSAHPIVPFYGQGMNAGFEDVTYLNELMESYHDDWETIFPMFFNHRKPHGDAVGNLALRNFIEMRDLVADPHFILKNKIDKLMESHFEGKWITLYRMVTFAETPYREAWDLGLEHDHILEKIILENPDIESKLLNSDIKNILEKYI